MIEAELAVCTECGNLHMEGGGGPEEIEECVVCGEYVDEVELDDVIGL